METPEIASGIFSNFPEEIMEEVLLRLPVRSLVRFKCICKSFRSLFSSDEFIESHLKISGKNANQGIIFTTFDPSKTIQHCPLNSLVPGAEVESTDFHFPMKEFNLFRIVSSCNGLLCIMADYKYFCLWNPSTRKSKILSPVKDIVGDVVIRMYGFGFDEANKDYKVVVSFRWWSGQHQNVPNRNTEVYSLKSNSWKSAELFEDEFPSDRGGKFVSGKLHWVRLTMTKLSPSPGPEIISFCLTNEVWGKIELPSPDDYSREFSSWVGVVVGCLCVTCPFVDREVDVWVLKEYGVEESWQRLFKMTYNEWLLYSTPSCSGPNGTVLFLWKEMFVMYDVKRNGFTSAKLGDSYYLKDAYTFVESLVPLPE